MTGATQMGEEFKALGRELALEQDRELAQDLSLGSVRTRIVGRSVGRPSRAKVLVGAAALVGVAAAVTIYAVHRPSAPLSASVGEHALAVGEWVSATESAASPIRFSDGSEVKLAVGSRARLATLHAAGAHLVIESGAASVNVTPGRDARYRVSVGPFAVDVTGTRFDVGFRPSDELFTLSLHEGRVVVSGCVLGEGRPLLAGESLSASCRAGHFEISALNAARSAGENAASAAGLPSASAAAVEAGEPAAIEPMDEPAPAAGPEPVASGRASWQALSRQGQFADAYSAVMLEGFAAAVARASVVELALLGDTARFAAKPGDALIAYQALRSRAGGSAAGKQAAFSIGRVHFDQRAAYAEAARWFRTYLSEQPGGPLAREAEGRLMESLSRGGDRAEARKVAERYLARHAKGPHERVARQLLGR